MCSSKPLCYTKYVCFIISIHNYVVGFNKPFKIVEWKQKQNNTVLKNIWLIEDPCITLLLEIDIM